MEQAILTDTQKEVLRIVNDEPRLDGYYLSGGTALSAYYLHHRVSDDLDFFTSEPCDRAFLTSFIDNLKFTLGADRLRSDQIFDRNLYFLGIGDYELKLEFTRYPFARLDPIRVEEGVRVDSLRDVSANKFMALLNRFDPKDFVDLYAILQNRPLADIRRDAETKFGSAITDLFLGSELAKVRRVEALPKMTVPLGIDELKRFVTKEARALSQSFTE